MRCPNLIELPPSFSKKTGWPWTEESPQLPDSISEGSPWPRISVVTPSYNQGQFIEETIRSVLLQGYPNLEYIVIDGESTDHSVEIICKYKPWLAYWVSEKDRGQSHAINKGWLRATGSIVCWLNSDDYLMPNALIQVAEAFQINPDAGLIHGNAINIDHFGNRMERISGSPFELQSSIIQSIDPVAQPAAFIPRKILLEVGYLDEDLHMIMDWDLWMRIAANYPTYYYNKNWAAFRVWLGAKGSINFNRSYQEQLVSVKKLLFHIKPKQIPLRGKLRALAAAYGRDALYRYQINDQVLFRWHLFLSLCLSPQLKGGKGKGLIPEMFFGKPLVQLLIKIKKRINNGLSR